MRIRNTWESNGKKYHVLICESLSNHQMVIGDVVYAGMREEIESLTKTIKFWLEEVDIFFF